MIYWDKLLQCTINHAKKIETWAISIQVNVLSLVIFYLKLKLKLFKNFLKKFIIILIYIKYNIREIKMKEN